MFFRNFHTAQFATTFSACLAIVLAAVSGALGAANEVALTPKLGEGDLHRVKIHFELTGELKLKESGEGSTAPVNVDAQFVYDEKLMNMSSDALGPTRAVRHYEKADANLRFEEGIVRSTLREDRRIVAVSSGSPSEVLLFSPLGPLNRDELDLIDVPASSTLINHWLPRKSVKVGDTWNVQSDFFAPVLGIDSIGDCNIQCKLDRVEGDLAIVHAQGEVTGSVGGIACVMRLAAKYSFDLSQQRINWFAMSVKDKRAIGRAQPGIDVLVRIQMAISPLQGTPYLHNDVLADLNFDVEESSGLLEFVSQGGGFGLLVSRDWHVMVNREDLSVLRLVDTGDEVGQCNLSALPPLAEDEAFTITKFQEDVKRALGDNFQEFVTANESWTSSGVHVLRLVARGETSGVPIDWIYCHLSNEAGRRASCIFTHQTNLADRFGAADQLLLGSFHFLEQEE